MTDQFQLLKQGALSTLMLAASLLCGQSVKALSFTSGDTVANYQLGNVKFDDGQSAIGTFSYDFTTGTLVAVNITAEGGYFNNSPSYPITITLTSFDGNYDTQQVSYSFAFTLDTPLTSTSGSAITLDHSQSYLIVDETGQGGPINTTYITSGRVSLVPTAPVPEASSAASLALGFLVLTGLMLCGRRQKSRPEGRL